MNELLQKLEELSAQIEEIRKKLKRQDILSPEELDETRRLLEAYGEEQARYLGAYQQEMACQEDELPKNLNVMEETLRVHRLNSQRMARLRQMRTAFLSVRGADETYTQALLPVQNALAQLDDEALLAMDTTQLPYQQFLDHLHSPDDRLTQTLGEIFGLTVAIGLAYGKYRLPEETRENTASAETVPTEIQPEPEIPTPEQAAPKAAEPKPEPVPLPEPEPESAPFSEGEALRIDEKTLGELAVENSGKKPRGVTSLKSAFRTYGSSLMVTIRHLSQWRIISLAQLEQLCAEMEIPAKPSVGLGYLYKEGYLTRYTFNGEAYYSLNSAGQEIFRSPTLKQQVFQGRKWNGRWETISGPAEFLRLRYTVDYYLDARASLDEDWILGGALNQTQFPYMHIDDGNANMAILYFPAIFADTDSAEELQNRLNLMAKWFTGQKENSPSPKVFVTCPPEQASAWRDILRQYGNLPEESDFFFAPTGSEAFFDKDNSELSFRSILRNQEKLEAFLHGRKAEIFLGEHPEEPAEGENIKDVGNASALARKILDADDPLIPEPLAELMALLPAEGYLLEASLLAKTLTETTNGENWQQIFHSLIYATDLPLAAHPYSGSMTLDKRTDQPLERYCQAAVMFRALGFPDNAYDHELYNTFKGQEPHLLDGLPDAFAVPARKAAAILTGELKELSFRCDGGGFSQNILRALASNEVREQQLAKLRQEAREKQAAPRSKISIRGLETFSKTIFGPASLLGQCMKDIAEGEEDIGMLREIDAEFSGDGERPDVMKMEQFIDTEWLALRSSDKAIKVKRLENDSPARNLILRELEKRLEIIHLCLRWNSGSELVPEPFLADFQTLSGRYRACLEEALSAGRELLELPDTEIPIRTGIQLLSAVFRRTLAVLEGSEPLSRSPAQLFTPLLGTPHIALDGDGYPALYESMNQIPGMEPWRLVLGHIRDKGNALSLAETLERLETPDLDEERYEDYGSARALRQALGMPVLDYTMRCRAAREDCLHRREAFRGEVLLARAYSQAPEDVKETLFALDDRFGVLFAGLDDEGTTGTDNYAHYRLFLRALQAELDRLRKARQEEFLEQYDRLVAQSGGDPPPILDKMRNEIVSNNFAMAEEYRMRYESGETETADLDALGRECNFHEQFLSCADFFAEQCEKSEHKSRAIKSWGGRVLRQKNFWSAGNERKADHLLEYWISRKGDGNNPELLQGFFTMLGFQVTEVLPNRGYPTSPQYEVFQASVRATSGGLRDYPHPVAKFGTMLPPVMNIVCLYGCKGSSTLIDIMTQKLQLSGATVVLMDGVLSTNERRRVAARFKTMTSGQNSFLLIDRVLLLYLASLDLGSQLPAMLQCTLPYTYEQLHNEGSGPVPDEMYIGRLADRRSISDPAGASLVYGGRQLGKTALLQRVKSTNHHPETGSYAIYLDIKNQTMDYLLRQFNRELGKLNPGGRPLVEQPCESLTALCETLEDRAEDFQYLLILLDEVDALFDELAEQGYEALHAVVALRQNTKNKVKFVFAGTHNVAASVGADWYNRDILPLGKPLCIAPLSMADATKLIREPLSYLGFRIGAQQIALILANTASYPGLIHLLCNALVKSVCENYTRYYSDGSAPPYTLSDAQLKLVFQETDVKDGIRTRMINTIKLNRKYWVTANLLAYLEYQDQERDQSRFYGYTPEELLRCNEMEFQIPQFLSSAMRPRELQGLMTEMENMGILWHKPDTNSYRFRQRDFLDFIGSYDEVVTMLLEEPEMEGQR